METTIPPAPGKGSTIAQRLRWAREMREHKSDRAAANELGFVLSTYRKHESGERGDGGLKEHHLKRYARGFRINWTWLATGEGNPTAPTVDSLTEEESRVVEAMRSVPLERQTDVYRLVEDLLKSHAA